MSNLALLNTLPDGGLVEIVISRIFFGKTLHH